MENNADRSPNINPPQPVNQTPYQPVPAVSQVSPQPQISPSVIQNQDSTESESQNNPFYLTFGFWAFILFSINLIVIFFLWVYPLFSPPILVEDQPLGESFYIKRIRVPSPSFVALKVSVTGDDGTSTLTLAKSAILIPDTYEDFYIQLEDEETLPREFLDSIQPGASIIVALYKDSDGDTFFNPDTDITVVKDIFGRRVQGSFLPM